MIVLHLTGWQALGFVLQFILPLLVGLVTTKLTNSKNQALLLAGLTVVITAATSILTAHDAGQTVDLGQILIAGGGNFLISVGAHFGIWKPSGLASLAVALFDKTATPAPATGPAIIPNPAPAIPAPAVTDPATTLHDPVPVVDAAPAVSRMAG